MVGVKAIITQALNSYFFYANGKFLLFLHWTIAAVSSYSSITPAPPALLT
jgi:hypothetical protein